MMPCSDSQQKSGNLADLGVFGVIFDVISGQDAMMQSMKGTVKRDAKEK